MFAYCNNNPVMGYDPSGCGFFGDLWDSVCETADKVVDTVAQVVDPVVDKVVETVSSPEFNKALDVIGTASYYVGVGLLLTAGTIATGGALGVVGGGVVAAACSTTVVAAGAGACIAGGTAKIIGETNSNISYSKMTNSEATKAADKLGYKPVNGQRSHGQKIFTDGKDYITPDVDSHNGGVWKKAKKIRDLFSKNRRMGTFDANLRRMKK